MRAALLLMLALLAGCNERPPMPETEEPERPALERVPEPKTGKEAGS